MITLWGRNNSTNVKKVRWVLEELGRVPEPGDRFTWENLDVTVTRAEHHRVLEIRVVVLEEEKETPSDHK